jgi:O-antigen/teichoic acid export membrane protein
VYPRDPGRAPGLTGITRLVYWTGQGGLAVVDQGFFAASNFLVSMLLARWLAPGEYGAFALVYSFFLLLFAFHTSVLAEPMLVFGAGKYADHFSGYLGFLVRGHWAFAGLMSAMMAVAGGALWYFEQPLLAEALWGLAVSAPFVLLIGLLRRALYARFQPQLAAAGGALYSILVTLGMYGLYRGRWLSSFWALAMMGVASGIVGLWFLALLRPQGRLPDGNPPPRMVLADHWRYGTWSVVASLMAWLSGNVQSFALAVATDLPTVGAMRALDTVLLPYWHFHAGLSGVLLPAFSRLARDQAGDLPRQTFRMGMLFMLQGALVWTGLGLFGDRLVSLLYGGAYAEYGYLLLPYALRLIPDSGATVVLIAWRSMLAIRLVWVYDAVLFGGLVVAFVFALPYGLPGVVYARVLLAYVSFIVCAFVAVRALARRS